MTTTVIIKAHCADYIDVVVSLDEGEHTHEVYTLQDGESKEIYVYGSRTVSVQEQLKTEQA